MRNVLTWRVECDSDYGGTWGDQGSSAIMGGGGQFPGLSPGMAGMLGSIGNLVDADNAIMSMMNDLLIPLPIGQHGGDALGGAVSTIAIRNGGVGCADARCTACSQPSRPDRTMDHGVEM